MKKNKILTIGDSNASDIVGRSWPYFLSDKLEYELLNASSPGAGNSFYIEKLHAGLKEFNPDLVVIQLTQPTRITTGVSTLPDQTHSNEWNHPNVFRDFKCYTWNAYNNEYNLKTISGVDVKIDKFWTLEVSTSKWVDYKVAQDIFTMNSLCEYFDAKVIFWSWFDPFENYFLDQYKWLKNKITWIDGCALKFLKETNQTPLPDYHYGSKEHNFLVENWLYPQLLKKLCS